MANYVAGKADAGFQHETFAGWHDVFGINAFAAFFVVRAFSELLVKGAEARGSTACVINVGSVSVSLRYFIPILSVGRVSILNYLCIFIDTLAHRSRRTEPQRSRWRKSR